MDFELTEDQRAITAAMTKLLAQRAGPARARALFAASDRAYDHDLDAALEETGFLAIVPRADAADAPEEPGARARGTSGTTLEAGAAPPGALEAGLVLEAIAERAGLVGYGPAAIVAPLVLGGERLRGPVAIAT